MADSVDRRQYADQAVQEAIQRLQHSPDVAQRRWRGFHVADGVLIHSATNRQVVPLSRVVPLLTELYAQPSWKSGRDRFHARVAERYVGISRRDVMDFLRRQETWQLHRPIRRLRVRQVVLSRRPLDHWQMDLVDFTAHTALNNGHRFVLTVMDCFTKYAWARPLKSKHAASVAAALRDVLGDPVLAGRTPKIIQSDNGTEFQERVSRLLADRNIKHVFSAAYRPTTQGMIERFNGTLKRALFEHMSQFGTRKWNDVLPEICGGYNASRHSVTGAAPAALMDPAASDEALEAAITRIRAAARKRLNRSSVVAGSFSELHVGDTVRLSARTDAETRRMELLGQHSGTRTNWSRELFVVTHISEPSADALALPSYRIETSDGEPLRRRFYRDDLQRVGADTLMTNEARRPDYSRGSLFNQEVHLSALPARRRAAAAAPRRSERRKARNNSVVASPVRPVRPQRRSSRQRARRRPLAPNGAQEQQPRYEVAEIMQQRQRNRRPIYLVRWVGFPDEVDWTWEPKQHIKNTPAFALWRGAGMS
jgi:transposase InsO family protein